MKIALACNHYPPEFLGGTERIVQALAKGLVAHGDEVTVLCSTEHEPSVEDVDGVGVHRFAHAADEPYGLRVERPGLLGRALQVLQEQSVEVLHVHHWSHLSDRLLQEAKALGIAGIATLHDMWTHCPRFFRLPPAGADVTCPETADHAPCVPCANLDYNTREDELIAMFMDRDKNIMVEASAAGILTAPSRSCADAFVRHTGLGRDVRVVPHGLLRSVAVGQPNDREAHAPFRIGSFGNHGREKGSMQLVEAAAGLPEVEVHFWGAFVDAGFAAMLQERATKLGLSVTCHGRYGENGPHPATQLDLAVFFSQCEETYGLVVDEALAHGLPVVVSDRGALPERVARGGGIVAHDTGQLRDAVWKVTTNPAEWRRLRGAIPASFPTVADAVQTYRGHYRQLLDGHS